MNLSDVYQRCRLWIWPGSEIHGTASESRERMRRAANQMAEASSEAAHTMSEVNNEAREIADMWAQLAETVESAARLRSPAGRPESGTAPGQRGQLTHPHD